MRFRVWLLEFMPWRLFLGHVCDWIVRRWPDLGYTCGYHVGLCFSMMAWAIEQRSWPAYYAVRDEIIRRGYKTAGGGK